LPALLRNRGSVVAATTAMSGQPVIIESAARQLVLDLGRRAKESDTSSRLFQ
jgi:hypothetical protein